MGKPVFNDDTKEGALAHARFLALTISNAREDEDFGDAMDQFFALTKRWNITEEDCACYIQEEKDAQSAEYRKIIADLREDYERS